MIYAKNILIILFGEQIFHLFGIMSCIKNEIMKKIAFFAVLIFLTSACNNQPNVNNPTNWLRGELVPVVSPFNENDTVLAMKVKYNFHSDYNGKTFYILKNNNSKAIQNKLFSILDDEGNRLDSLEICRCDRKSGCDGRTFIILYPRKTLSDLSPEVLKCEEVLEEREINAIISLPIAILAGVLAIIAVTILTLLLKKKMKEE